MATTCLPSSRVPAASADRAARHPATTPALRFAVPIGRTRTIDGHARQTVVRCESGEIWLTQAGDGRDIVLGRGDRFVCERRGPVVIEALRDAVVCVDGRTPSSRA